MIFIVQDSLKVKTPQGERTLNAGQIISLTESKAEGLIAAGMIRLIDKPETLSEAMKEVMSNGQRSWCQTACMLSFPSQWSMCERFKPKRCIKLEGRN